MNHDVKSKGRSVLRPNNDFPFDGLIDKTGLSMEIEWTWVYVSISLC